jgi:hypothetical protein
MITSLCILALSSQLTASFSNLESDPVLIREGSSELVLYKSSRSIAVKGQSFSLRSAVISSTKGSYIVQFNKQTSPILFRAKGSSLWDSITLGEVPRRAQSEGRRLLMHTSIPGVGISQEFLRVYEGSQLRSKIPIKEFIYGQPPAILTHAREVKSLSYGKPGSLIAGKPLPSSEYTFWSTQNSVSTIDVTDNTLVIHKSSKAVKRNYSQVSFRRANVSSNGAALACLDDKKGVLVCFDRTGFTTALLQSEFDKVKKVFSYGQCAVVITNPSAENKPGGLFLYNFASRRVYSYNFDQSVVITNRLEFGIDQNRLVMVDSLGRLQVVKPSSSKPMLVRSRISF